MSSKRRLRRKSCEGKIKHKTREDAIKAIRNSGWTGLNYYKCSFCGNWHIGHTPKRIKNFKENKI